MRTAAALAAALLAGGGFASRGDQRPSIVLVTLDTTRADRVGNREGGASLTPNLDALARSGTRFSNALTPSPLTLPAHCSLMTGLDPPEHGVRDNGVASLPEDVPTLAAALGRRGYATGAVIASRVLDRRFGLARGFGVYDDTIVAEQTGEQGYRSATPRP
jgi:choline-sulfatase